MVADRYLEIVIVLANSGFEEHHLELEVESTINWSQEIPLLEEACLD